MERKAIICIDDEVIVLDSLKEQLMNSFAESFIVETAENAAEAIEIYEELKEDNIEVPIVISDYLMPDVTGDKVLEKIYKDNPSIKTILLTGQANVGGIEYAVNKANLYRFISKPWDKDDLVLTVKEAILSFDQQKKIDQKNKELYELNQSLELKVEQRTTELKELNATKDKFFSIIAHDLKNPFHTILGFAEILSTGYDDFPVEKQKEFVQIILDTSKNAYELLENLLDWSRSQTNRIKVDPQQLLMNEIVDNTIEILRNAASKKKISITRTDDLGNAFADQNMVKTIIRNLCSNAIKFTPKNGSVSFSSEELNGMNHISVKDTGIGMDQDQVKNLFKIDQSVSTEGTDKEQGTGLGLILCKEFAMKNNGDIKVTSMPESGSNFTLILPVSS